MTLLGLIPTFVVLLGLITAAAHAARTRGRSPEAPLVVMALLGILTFVVFTWQRPTLAAVKGSYLLPLAVPAGVFFARDVRLLGRRLRPAVLLLSACAAMAATIVFTNGVLYSTELMQPAILMTWHRWAEALPSKDIIGAMSFLFQAGQ